MIVEGLFVLITGAINGGLFLVIEIEEVFQVRYLQLTDATLIFVLKDITSLLNVQRTLRWFSKCSGLRINYHKSFLIGINVN